MRKKIIEKYYINAGDITQGRELLPKGSEVYEIELTFEPINGFPIILAKSENAAYEIRYATPCNDVEDPRTSMDNIGNIFCFHKKYNLGDKSGIVVDDFLTWNELDELIEEKYGPILVMVPVFMLDHSGITIATHPFSDYWDSGRIGTAFVTEEDAVKNFSKQGERFCSPKEIRSKAHECIELEVVTYDQYLTGDVYMLVRERLDGSIHKCLLNIFESHDYDVCSEFYGHEYAKKTLIDNTW